MTTIPKLVDPKFYKPPPPPQQPLIVENFNYDFKKIKILSLLVNTLVSIIIVSSLYWIYITYKQRHHGITLITDFDDFFYNSPIIDTKKPENDILIPFNVSQDTSDFKQKLSFNLF